MQRIYDLRVSHAGIEAIHFLLVHFYKSFLRGDVLIGFLLEEESLHQLEEAVRVKREKPAEELLISCEAHNIVHVYAPLERRESTLGELFAFEEHLHDPHEFVPDVCLRVLDLQLLPPGEHRLPLCWLLLSRSLRWGRSPQREGVIVGEQLEYVALVLLNLAFHHHVVQRAK